MQQLNSGVKGNVKCMKAEKYLLDYIEQSHISKERVREVIGIDIEKINRFEHLAELPDVHYVQKKK